MLKCMRKLLNHDGGATAIEYAMIAALVSVLAITAFVGVTNSINTNYFSLIGSLSVR